MNITFIGNCQMLSLCYFFQQLLNSTYYKIFWISYSEDFNKHLGLWSNKCKNKITDYDISIKQIKNSDIIIYQNVKINLTLFAYTEKLNELKKNTCRLIQISSIYLIYKEYDDSIKKLQDRENNNNSNIKVSYIFEKYRNDNLMLTYNHPKTFLFLEIIKELCILLNVDFFNKDQYDDFLKNENFMELP
jgi:hypothetical protein